MNKFFSFVVATCLSLGSLAAATSFSFTSDASISQTIDGYTVVLDQGAGTSYPVYNNYMRLYAKNTITVTGDSIRTIQIVFTKQGSKPYAGLTASTGTLVPGGESTSTSDYKVDSWSGEADSVVFTLGESGQRVITQLVVNGQAVTPEPENPDTTVTPVVPGELDTAYVYAEPTVVAVPAKTVQGAAYQFIENNIQVSCTKGAIYENYFSCHAGFAMTFTATKPMKGLVIDGFVKKDFEASVDNGEISYLSPAEDTEAEPVVVITDINAQTVTISCVKQLRCYEVAVYFEANPEDSIEGGISGEGEVYFLTFNSAEAIYESEITEDEGEVNYTIYLYNDSTDYPYLTLDLYPGEQGDLTGVYDFETGSLGEYTAYQLNEDWLTGAVFIMEGSVAITKEENIYSISGYITCDDNNTYNFTFTGEMPFYIDTEYYQDDEAIEQTNAAIQVKKVLRNGQLYIIRGDKTYNVLGF